MRAKKWHQRNSTVMRFCFQTFLHTICVTHSVQGFAKKRPTWKLSNRLWGIKTSRLRWTFMPKQPNRKNKNRLNDWLQHWMFFNQRRRALTEYFFWQQNSPRTANWHQIRESNGDSRRITNIWKSHKTVIVKHHEALWSDSKYNPHDEAHWPVNCQFEHKKVWNFLMIREISGFFFWRASNWNHAIRQSYAKRCINLCKRKRALFPFGIK